MASPPGFRAVAAVMLQVGGVSVRAGFRCDAPAGFTRGTVESFLVQIYRCCSCLFVCADESHMTSHLRTHLSPAPTTNHTPSPGHMMSAQEFSDAGDKEEDEDLFLYDMFDISAQGEELQVAHTCQVSSLFEEHCPLFKEDTDQSAHLRTLGLCRISAPRSPPRSPPHSSPQRSPPMSPSQRSPPTSPQNTASRVMVQTEPTRGLHGPRRRSIQQRALRVRPRSTKTGPHPPRKSTSPGPAPSPHRRKSSATIPDVSGSKKKICRKKNPQKQMIFSCSECNRTFSSALTLRRHAGVHSDLRPFSCSLCPYSSRLKASLLQHQRTHSGERPFRCPVCPYASIDRSSLLRHQRTHNDERPHSCPRCPYSSIQKRSLDLHMQRHHR